MGKPYPQPSFLVAAWLLAVSSAVVPGAAAEIGDFAPLAAGNTWTYHGTEQMHCKSLWDRITVSRILTVDSSRNDADGATYFLSYRDSVHWNEYGRWKGPFENPEDAVRTGRFRVRERTGQRELRVTSFGSDSLPSEMEIFFRSHTYPADRITPDTGGMASGGEVRYRRHISGIVRDNATYVKDVGMTYLSHDYNVYNTNNFTAPQRLATYQLIAFNGAPGTPGGPWPAGAGEVPGDALSPKDFAPVALGFSWTYLGIRRVDSAGTSSRDSICRSITVKSAGEGLFVLTLKDSLYARLRADKPLEPVNKSVDFRVGSGVALANGNGGIGIWDNDSDPAWSDPLRFFNGKRYPARDVEEMAFPDKPRSVVVYAERSPGILIDTSVYAEGVGLVRRAKTLYEGRTFTEEFRLIEFQGKDFQAIPVSLAASSAPAASAAERIIGRGAARLPVRTWRGRDAAGKSIGENRKIR